MLWPPQCSLLIRMCVTRAIPICLPVPASPVPKAQLPMRDVMMILHHSIHCGSSPGCWGRRCDSPFNGHVHGDTRAGGRCHPVARPLDFDQRTSPQIAPICILYTPSCAARSCYLTLDYVQHYVWMFLPVTFVGDSTDVVDRISRPKLLSPSDRC